MSTMRISVPVFLSLLLTNCGTYVPEIQEPPFGSAAQQELVQAIVTSVHCEVINAVVDLYEDAKTYPDLRPIARNMRTWGVQMALTLKTRENSTANPSGVWTPQSLLSFTLGASGTLSSEAIRTNILNFYYSVADLRRRGKCKTGVQPVDYPVTSLLIRSDLKFKQWLYDQLLTAATGETQVPVSTDSPLKQNVLSHEVSFEVVTTGGINPAWKLTEANFNQSGTFLQATRDRTHDLLITMGPGDNAGLTGAARDAHLAATIGGAIANHSQILQPR
jgi:hypothetical protein